MVFKNKTLAPVSEVHHTNDVLVKYDPAVFKYAVETATEAMNEGTEYETDKLNIKVMKIRPEGDLTGAKVDNLITFEMSSKLRPEVKIKQQMHIYYTSQSFMVQGSRMLNGVKGYKVFLEDFLHPLLEKVILMNKVNIVEMKEILNNVKLTRERNKTKDDDNDKEPIVAENQSIGNSSKNSYIECAICDQMFPDTKLLEDHIEKLAKVAEYNSEIVVENENKNNVRIMEPQSQKINDETISSCNKLLTNKCISCEGKFKTSTALEQHIKDQHKQDKDELVVIQSNKCDRCEKICIGKNDMIKHMIYDHESYGSSVEENSNGIICMIRNIASKEDDNTSFSNESDSRGLKRNHSVTPPKIKTNEKKDRRDNAMEVEMNSDNNEHYIQDNIKTLKVEIEVLNNAVKVLKDNLTQMKEEKTRNRAEAEDREEDIKLLKDENVSLKNENTSIKAKFSKLEKDSKEVLVKVTEGLKDDIDKRKEEVDGVWKEFRKLKKEQEDKYNIIADEYKKVTENMVEMQKLRPKLNPMKILRK